MHHNCHRPGAVSIGILRVESDGIIPLLVPVISADVQIIIECRIIILIVPQSLYDFRPGRGGPCLDRHFRFFQGKHRCAACIRRLLLTGVFSAVRRFVPAVFRLIGCRLSVVLRFFLLPAGRYSDPLPILPLPFRRRLPRPRLPPPDRLLRCPSDHRDFLRCRL